LKALAERNALMNNINESAEARALRDRLTGNNSIYGNTQFN